MPRAKCESEVANKPGYGGPRKPGTYTVVRHYSWHKPGKGKKAKPSKANKAKHGKAKKAKQAMARRGGRVLPKRNRVQAKRPKPRSAITTVVL